MKYKKIMLILITAIFLASIAGAAGLYAFYGYDVVAYGNDGHHSVDELSESCICPVLIAFVAVPVLYVTELKAGGFLCFVVICYVAESCTDYILSIGKSAVHSPMSYAFGTVLVCYVTVVAGRFF